jgi:hypothetical protein
MINFWTCCKCSVKHCREFDSFSSAIDKNRNIKFDSRGCRKFQPFEELKVPFLSLAFIHNDKSANAVVQVLSNHNLKLKDYRFFR